MDLSKLIVLAIFAFSMSGCDLIKDKVTSPKTKYSQCLLSTASGTIRPYQEIREICSEYSGFEAQGTQNGK